MNTLKANLTLIISLVLLAALSNSLFSQNLPQPPAEVAAELQLLLDESLPTGINSGALMGVYAPGKWEWYGASGKANRNNSNEMAQPDYQFRIGSISKSFAAVAIMQLKESGLLQLDDSISNYLRPSLIADTIPWGDQITVRQLLSHTSGVNELADNTACFMEIFSDMSAPQSLEKAISCGCSLGALFSPGSGFSYSNTNYSILAMIVEEITGTDFNQYITDSIIVPLGLANTLVPPDPVIADPHMGCWYTTYSVDMTDIHQSVYKGWANVVSTTEDLIKYYIALRSGDLISPASVSEMFTPCQPGTSYGLGAELDFSGNQTMHGHSGEVGNTSGWYYSNIINDSLPGGYYIVYNFNYQGVYHTAVLNTPVHNYLAGLIDGAGIAIETKHAPGIYPNPAKDFFRIIPGSCINGFCRLDVFNMAGRKVIEKEFGTGDNMILYLGNLPDGFYIYRLSDGVKSHTGKIIVER